MWFINLRGNLRGLIDVLSTRKSLQVFSYKWAITVFHPLFLHQKCSENSYFSTTCDSFSLSSVAFNKEAVYQALKFLLSKKLLFAFFLFNTFHFLKSWIIWLRFILKSIQRGKLIIYKVAWQKYEKKAFGKI